MENGIGNKKLWLSCLKATELIDKKSVVKLSVRENLQLKMHTSICNACKEYEKQSIFLSTLISTHIQKTNIENLQIVENKSLKFSILRKINEEK